MRHLPKIALLLAVVLCCTLALEGRDDVAAREKANQLFRNGNWKEAYALYSKLSTDGTSDPRLVVTDYNNAVQCLQRLGRISEVDAFREKVVDAHAKNWRVLQTVAQSYMNVEHWGAIVAGEYIRGPHRGGTAKFADSFERDRTRALQLMQQAFPLVKTETNKNEVGQFYLNLATMLISSRHGQDSWRLQYLTDLKALPDYEEAPNRYYFYRRGYGMGSRGAPTDADGNPVYHTRPKSWDAAETDGQRWRWCLVMAVEYHPALDSQVRMQFAGFLHNQFGVQTMAQWGHFFGRQADVENRDKSGPYALTTLGETETIARLAVGIRRFKLPDEFNFIKIYQEVSGRNDGYSQQARTTLGQIFENRQQYPKAAGWWRQAGEIKRVTQIVGNWGMFEPVMTQPAGGKGATVDFRFRNGKKVEFVAHEILIEKLIDDVKAFLKSNPDRRKQEDREQWEKVNIANVGWQLVQQKHKQYEGKEAARWSETLQPRAAHFDKRITVQTPLKNPGAYLLTSKMDDGNTCFIVLWVADTAIVKKQLDKQVLIYVADAATGKPVVKSNVEFFGYWQEYQSKTRTYTLHTTQFAELTDADGQILLAENKIPQHRYQWIIQARGGDDDKTRYAWYGWTGVWYGNWYDQPYNAVKTFFISDRPVYRPGQTVKFKFWSNQAQYDREGKSPYAGQQVETIIRSPRNEEVFKKVLKIDDFGGYDSEWELPKDATLGMYHIQVRGLGAPHFGGGGSFRVEEYKKPEFEVTVEAPKEPVMLGEKVTATIQAKYLFGAPVKEGKVKYKVTRTSFNGTWYPITPWDWYYGVGYWWFAYDYVWYPGWHEWGCKRPTPWWWWHGRWAPPQQPEIVSENEVEVGKDGTVKVEIDTALAKMAMGDEDHKYEVSAEVTDQSRRTITGSGAVLVARKPFKTYAWVNRGHYRVGDTVHANFRAQRLDSKPVQGKGTLKLIQITYDKDREPVEKVVQTWDLPTDEEGCARQQITAAKTGQYRLSYTVTDAKGHAIEGGYVFIIAGPGLEAGEDFRFNELELVADKKDYKPDEKVQLRINTNLKNATVLLFVRPANGIGQGPPKTLRLKGRSAEETIVVTKKDMPNFFVEALTIADGRVYQEMREIVVPPEKRILNVEVTPLDGQADKGEPMKYKPGQKAKVRVKLTDTTGEPYEGSTVITMYDKAVEYISGGSNVGNIREFFWKWRRHHNLQHESSLSRGGYNMIVPNTDGMSFLGVFGHLVADLPDANGRPGELRQQAEQHRRGAMTGGEGGAGFGMAKAGRAMELADAAPGGPPMPMAAAPPREMAANGMDRLEKKSADKDGGGGEPAMAEATVRTNFADTAFWAAAVTTAKNGVAEIEVTMPENLTTWTTKVWAMGGGCRVGEGETAVLTTKNLIIRLQAPRFFVEKDEVVLSANVHNYLKGDVTAKVLLELEGKTLELMPGVKGEQSVKIDAGGEKRVDWRVKVVREGTAVVRMKALTTEESDAMQMEFPVYVHGMLKMESFCGVMRPDKKTDSLTVKVPAERRPEQTRLEIRYSPTLAGAMVDALPYLVEYPYGCTEQTLNRFLPTVITQKVILQMGINLKELQDKITNLNAQEIGDDVKRAADWKRLAGTKRWDGAKWVDRNPVFDMDKVADMVKEGLQALYSMQCGDGGWGWFSGWGEHSYPHTTALVVHGLQIARGNDVAVVPDVISRGIEWLKRYQAEQVRRLQLPEAAPGHKHRADALDAFVYMVLVDEKVDNLAMREFLYRDRIDLPVYAKSMFGIALHRIGDIEKRDMLIRNIEQYLVQDDENFTAYLKLPENNWWWCWYGSEYEAQAYYLKLLAVTQPKSEKASRLVKYLINNRRHATYWSSTRDTAVVIEAFADYIKASGEDKPNMTVDILVDGRQVKQVKITKENLFVFDNKVVLEGAKLTTGQHKIEFRKAGEGPLYWNAYLTNFTLEDHITKAGLEIKVNRQMYKLIPVDKKVKRPGDRGQVLEQKVEKFDRQEIKNLDQLKSGDLVQVEMVIESKNDYEYIVIEDMKASGMEPVEVRSGYNGNEMGAYVEFRDERVVFFVRALARGKHSVSYRMRAEIPGRFSALPTKASAMYAPELKANSDEIKVKIVD
ncbi:MAG: MG2 domain protein [Planctomycetes bacterium ADurb.Bin126]|nr:MAG: MG2 domain protein [Planctomycetes bacterium ADurb.Bin126]HOD82246.1 MG2 domain-containing protein [Phycisphaerae bacterium]HQL73597.1 MG2 domain-containing protein [Phycisphaerae bacterium]